MSEQQYERIEKRKIIDRKDAIIIILILMATIVGPTGAGIYRISVCSNFNEGVMVLVAIPFGAVGLVLGFFITRLIRRYMWMVWMVPIVMFVLMVPGLFIGFMTMWPSCTQT